MTTGISEITKSSSKQFEVRLEVKTDVVKFVDIVVGVADMVGAVLVPAGFGDGVADMVDATLAPAGIGDGVADMVGAALAPAGIGNGVADMVDVALAPANIVDGVIPFSGDVLFCDVESMTPGKPISVDASC